MTAELKPEMMSADARERLERLRTYSRKEVARELERAAHDVDAFADMEQRDTGRTSPWHRDILIPLLKHAAELLEKR